MASTCIDGLAPPVTTSWCESVFGQSSARPLCGAVAAISGARCDQLVDETFLRQQIRSVGLTPDRRGSRLFGVEAGRIKRTATNGIFQDPHQLSDALIHLGRAPTRISTYLEVGVWTAWTNALVSAYLSRLSRGQYGFRGYACDRWDRYITKDTRKLLGALNVSVVMRNDEEYKKVLAESAPISLCFIDADHNYRGVRIDYEELAPRCRSMMFHDVIDFDTLTREGGGVPIFWSELVRSVERSRVHEFFAQPATYPPVFGIGIPPHATMGDGRIDAPSWQPAFMGAGRWPQAAAFWDAWLCKHTGLYKGRETHRWNSSLYVHCRQKLGAGAAPPEEPEADEAASVES